MQISLPHPPERMGKVNVSQDITERLLDHANKLEEQVFGVLQHQVVRMYFVLKTPLAMLYLVRPGLEDPLLVSVHLALRGLQQEIVFRVDLQESGHHLLAHVRVWLLPIFFFFFFFLVSVF